MSAGNTNTNGNKKNNFPYQFKVLQLLSAISNSLTGAVRTPNNVITSGVGSVPAGSLRGSVLNSGGSAGIWNGVSIPAGVSIPWGVCGENDTYGAIAYDATGTTFVIEYTT